jgi:hypothetical protein
VSVKFLPRQAGRLTEAGAGGSLRWEGAPIHRVTMPFGWRRSSQQRARNLPTETRRLWKDLLQARMHAWISVRN